ncbi:MAG: hypothetical protein AAFZ38_09690 [Myxococcota bacterium]
MANYAFNDPGSMVDPTGEVAEWVVAGLVSAAVSATTTHFGSGGEAGGTRLGLSAVVAFAAGAGANLAGVSFSAPSPGMTETLSESSRSFVGSFFGSSSGSAGASAGISLSLSPAAQAFVGNLGISAGTGLIAGVGTRLGSAGISGLGGLGGNGVEEPRRRRRRVAAGYHDELRSAEQVHRDNEFFLNMTNQERLVTGGVGLAAAAAGACAFVCGPYAVSVNARLYDPELGMFVSPDHLLPDAYNPLSYSPKATHLRSTGRPVRLCQ